MQAPGPAQLELIRRYARTLRQVQAEAARGAATTRRLRNRTTRMTDEPARFTRVREQGAEADAAPAPAAPA